MGKKRVPISLRKPPSPEGAAPRDEIKPEAEPPAAPAPEIAARVAEPEIAARVAEPEIAAPAVEPEASARVAEPEPAPPEVTAPIEEPPALPVVEALQRLVPEPPPAIVVGADGRSMRAVTVYLPAEVAERLVRYSRDKGLDAVREAIEATLGDRIGAGAGAAAGTPFARAARPVPPWSAHFPERGMARGLLERVERWIEHGRAVMTALRVHVRPVRA
jgi:hypothetical protein